MNNDKDRITNDYSDPAFTNLSSNNNSNDDKILVNGKLQNKSEVYKEEKNTDSNPTIPALDPKIMLIILLLIVAFVVAMPLVYKVSKKPKKVVGYVPQEKKEEKVVNEDVLEIMHYPIMRSSKYNSFSYYSKNKFKVSDMSNNDILANAFLDIYDSMIKPSNFGGSCTNTYKQFDGAYIKLRISNILGKDINYKLENFYVSEDSNTNYKGEWVYNQANDIFIYNGLCSSKATNTIYYDLTESIKVEFNEDDLLAYFYVNPVKVENNTYTIYKDYSMTDVLDTGSYSDYDSLVNIYSTLKKDKIYKYTFKDDICSYGEYCVYEGEWVDKL